MNRDVLHARLRREYEIQRARIYGDPDLSWEGKMLKLRRLWVKNRRQMLKSEHEAPEPREETV